MTLRWRRALRPAPAAPDAPRGASRPAARAARIACLALAACAALSCGRAPAPLGRGSEAPGFRLERAGAGEPVSLESARGRVVLVNFWATWCEPCEAEMPAMERLYRGLRDEGFELLAVSVDDDPEAVRAFRERHGLTFPILLDPDREVADAYQTYRFPESFLVDREGRVVERFIGEKDWDAPAYVALIRRLLADTAG